ncbi:MAG: DinB family protein [Dehalococcoidia bacterium]|nr:DinB family protein [Dehalococcoidia bacterium]
MVRPSEPPADLLARFARGPSLLRAAVAGLDAGALNRTRPGSDWSARDVVVHLADTELVRAVRFRVVLTEDEPVLAAFDEGIWKRRLHYLWRDPEAALALFEQIRFSSAEMLSRCGSGDWQRGGTHQEWGRVTLADLLQRGVAHVDDHCGQIAFLRGG